MVLEFLKVKSGVDWDRVSNDVEVVVCKVNDSLTTGAFDIGRPNVPLVRDGPVKCSRSAWNLMDGELWSDALDEPESCADAVTGQTSANREQRPSEGMHRFA